MRAPQRRRIIRAAVILLDMLLVGVLWLTPLEGPRTELATGSIGRQRQEQVRGLTAWHVRQTVSWSAFRHMDWVVEEAIWWPGVALGLAVTGVLISASVLAARSLCGVVSQARFGRADGRCDECGHDLRGSASVRCPECGTVAPR
jgi:hypothetical protein